MIGYFERGNTHQHMCELIKKNYLSNFFRTEGGGGFFDQKNKNQFLTSAQLMTLFGMVLGGISFR